MNHLERAAQQREQALQDFYSWCAVFGFNPVKDLNDSDKVQFKDQATQDVWLKFRNLLARIKTANRLEMLKADKTWRDGQIFVAEDHLKKLTNEEI